MKFALAFVLLIGISCQIGQGDCAPEVENKVYESLKDMVSEVYSLTQDTYHSAMNQLSSLSEYLPTLNNPLPDGLSDIKESMKNLGSETEDMMENLGSETEDMMKNLGSETEDMMKNGLNSMEDLGSEAENVVNSGMGHVSDVVD